MSYFAKKREDPANLYFKKPQVNSVRHQVQDIEHFATRGYTNLMDTSVMLGCLIYAIKNTLYVYTNEHMH